MRILFFVCLFVITKAGAQSAGPSPLSEREMGAHEITNTADETPAPMGVDLMAGNSKGITVYPNPANDHIMVSVAGKPKDKREIRLVTMMGHPILQLNNLRENTYLLDVSRLQKGIYVVEVISKGNITRTKWIKE